LNLGMSLLIAPEGTRSESGVLGPFKKGPFHVALNTGVTIVPMALMGVHRAKHRGSWLLHPGRVEARFGTPILIGEDSDMDSLRSKTREAIEALMQAECA
jgi:1-acyl-sn-glycerol-3-phosphate acyltransferase